MYKLLIVDDEPIIRQGIKQLVDFAQLAIDEVYEASEGRQALAVVHDKQPHIVLADINMPNMDGLALARSIKEYKRSIRVVIITGYDYFDYAVAALKAGVDDFILKPVSCRDIQELLQKLVNGIKQEELQLKALASLGGMGLEANGEKTDNIAYREEIFKAMENHIADPDFSLVKLSKEINLSTGYLSALFKQIFGIPFQEYLITMRLERSKILLLATAGKVYEISQKVGFEDPNYFSTSFKKRFGVSPNKYRDSVLDDKR